MQTFKEHLQEAIALQEHIKYLEEAVNLIQLSSDVYKRLIKNKSFQLATKKFMDNMKGDLLKNNQKLLSKVAQEHNFSPREFQRYLLDLKIVK